MYRSLLWKAGMVTMCFAASASGANAPSPFPPRETDVIVCLGDSITDGCTYPQILIQALKEAGKPLPAIVCSGAGGHTAPMMAARLDNSVLVYKPTIVTFSAGTNDSLRALPPATYETALREIYGKVKASGATMILLTPCIISSRMGVDEATRKASKAAAQAAEKLGAQYGQVIRKVAADEGYPVAENNALMRKARDAGKRVMSEDGIHPNYFGQSLIARSILDAMGCKDVPLPKEFKPQLFPGVIREWKMRQAPLDEKKRPILLTEETAAALEPDNTWVTYELPNPVPAEKPTAEDWWEQERRNGFGRKVQETVGKGPVQAVCYIDATEAQRAYINTAIGISTVWFNGTKVHDQGKAWTGFHAGKERIPVQLKPGRNVLAVEINGSDFFLSVTDKFLWEEDLR